MVSKATKELNVAIVGTGAVSRAHFASWKRVRSARIAAVCDIDIHRAREAAARYDVPKVYSNLSELLLNEQIDIIDICTPPQSHFSLVKLALEKGCHVFCEKPLCLTIGEAESLIETAIRKQRLLEVVRNIIYDPSVIEAKRICSQLGDVNRIHIEWLHVPKTAMDDKNHWVNYMRGGWIAEAMPHLIYLVHNFLGFVNLEYVKLERTRAGIYAGTRFSGIHLFLSNPKGIATVHLTSNSPVSLCEIRIYSQYRAFKVDLKTGIIAEIGYKPRPGEVALSKVDVAKTLAKRSLTHLRYLLQNTIRIALKSGQPFLRQIEEFVEAILSNQSPSANLDRIYHEVKLLDDICLEMERYEKEKGLY